jgi:hypothetical protein
MAPYKLKLTTMRFKNRPSYFLSQFYVCGANCDTILLFAYVHYPAERILRDSVLGCVIDLIEYLGIMSRIKAAAQENDTRRAAVSNPAAGRTDKFNSLLPIRANFFAVPAFVTEHSAA